MRSPVSKLSKEKKAKVWGCLGRDRGTVNEMEKEQSVIEEYEQSVMVPRTASEECVIRRRKWSTMSEIREREIKSKDF